jgi:hypothetical protein
MKGFSRRRPGRSLHEHFQEMPDPLIGHGEIPQDALDRHAPGLRLGFRRALPAANGRR